MLEFLQMSAAPALQLAPAVAAQPVADPLAGLIAALTSPDLYQIVERDGELFVEAVAASPVVLN